MRAPSDLWKEERGAEAIEFALVFPVVAFLVFGLIYGLLAVSAHVSLAHATSRGVRYASLAIDPVAGIYPSTEQVEAHVVAQTPFFGAEGCDTVVVGESRENAPVTLDVSCDFPNPMGTALSALKSFFQGSDGTEEYADVLGMSAHAEGRRE
jgi:Flp pilus assembly pilin Flp